LQTFSYPIGEPSGSCTRWSSRSCSSIALYILTGALTSPKTTLPDQIARGMWSGYPRRAPAETAVAPARRERHHGGRP
jgi:hypothetical protein